MKSLPLVSVIVPNYNHETYLRQRIESILNQTFQDFELILLDDCSTDNSRSVFESYRDNAHVSHIVYNNDNSGSPFKQWDKGISLARGEWIWIAESDDWAEPSFLQTLIETANGFESCGLCFCESNVVGQDGRLIYKKNLTVDSPQNYSEEDYYLRHMFFIDNVGQAIFKKSCVPVAEKRPYYESLKYCGDILFYTMLLERCDAVYVPLFLNNYRKHNDSVSGKNEDIGFGIYELVKIQQYLKPKYSNKQVLGQAITLAKMLNRKKRHFNVPKQVEHVFLKELWRFSRVGWILYWPIALVYFCKRHFVNT